MRHMATTLKNSTCVGVLLVVLCGLGACGQPQATSSEGGGSGSRMASSMSAYAAQLLQSDDGTMDDSQKDIVRAVADGGEVGVSAYESSWDSYLSCVVRKGYEKPERTRYPNGVYDEKGQSLPPEHDNPEYVSKWSDAKRDCYARYLSAVQELYAAQVGNPGLYSDHDEGALDCLKRADLVPRSMTVAQYRKEIEKWNRRKNGEIPRSSLDLRKADVRACMAANGMSFEGYN